MVTFSKVWYACYGSNLSFDRFSCYIRGGKPPGTDRSYDGCTDRTLPEKRKQYTLNHRLYFAKSSPVWQGGGVAFIDPTEDTREQTHGMIYLISIDQFREVVAQENDRSLDDPDIYLDLDAIIEDGQGCGRIVKGWYSLILLLGYKDEFPILTFTSSDILALNRPSSNYVQTIQRGLVNSYPALSKKEITGNLQRAINQEDPPAIGPLPVRQN